MSCSRPPRCRSAFARSFLATLRNMQVYICGPGPMLDAAAGLAFGHFESARIVARHTMVGSTSYCVPAADKAAGLTTPRTAYTSIKPGQTVKSQT
jgi:ferredoxin-NADP reductase